MTKMLKMYSVLLYLHILEFVGFCLGDTGDTVTEARGFRSILRTTCNGEPLTTVPKLFRYTPLLKDGLIKGQ